MLQKQKMDLQAQSTELCGRIEYQFKYLQQNMAPLLRESVMKSAVSKLPSSLRNLTGNFLHTEEKEKKTVVTENFSARKVIRGIAIGLTDIVPLFLKGKKGVILSIVLNQVVKRIVR